MARIQFTVTTWTQGQQVVTVSEDSNVYDMHGNRTVDPKTLNVGDKLCHSAGCPGAEITAKETLPEAP